MATTIVTKNSSTAAAVPTAGQLVQGELAVNVADKRLFTEDNGGTIVEVGTNPSTIDINAGTIDGTTIGASSASTGAFTTLTASGEITANGGIALGDNDKATFGAGDDLKVYHSGATGLLENYTGSLVISNASDDYDVIIQSDNGAGSLTDYFRADGSAGSALLYHYGSSKLATTATGIDVTGNVESDSVTIGVGAVAGTEKLRVNGTVLTLGGTVAAPAIGVGDVNTGIYAPTVGTLGWTVNGTQRLLLNSSGIDVTGTATMDGLVVQQGSGANILLESTTTGATTGDIFGEIEFKTNDSSSAGIKGKIDSYSEGGVGNGALRLFTGNTTGLYQRMNIASNGNLSLYEDTGTTAKLFWDASAESLGIGTSSPLELLHIESATTSPAILVKVDGQGGSTTPTAELILGAGPISNNDSACKVISYRIGDYSSAAVRTSGLKFQTTNANAPVTAMTLDNSGNIGIAGATGGPTYKLDGGFADQTWGWYLNSSYNAGFTYNTTERSLLLATKSAENIDHIKFATGSAATERVRITGAGDLLVGMSSSNYAVAGSQLGTGGNNFMTRSGAQPLLLNRLSSDGEVLLFMKDGTTVGSIGATSNNIYIGKDDTALYVSATTNSITPVTIASGSAIESNGNIDLGRSSARFKDLYLSGTANIAGGKISSYAADSNAPYFADAGNVGIRFSQAGVDDVVPCSSAGADRDNGINFGSAGARWGTVFAATGTINTSDQNEKQDIAELSEAEQRVAVSAKGLLRKFRWKDSVAEKGDEARIHFGVMAQDLQAAFAAEGLDASDYAMWCSDTWTDKETNEEKTRLGVRYSELLAFIIAAI